METIIIEGRILLAFVFLVAGLAKLADLPGSRKSMADFGVPAILAAPFGLLLPLGEIAIGVALLPSASAWWGGVAALCLLLLFIVGIGVNLVRGRTPDCHCFGKLYSRPIGLKTIVRNAIFCAVALLIIHKGTQQPALLGWTQRFSRTQLALGFGGGAFFFMLALALWLLLQVLKQNGRMLLRIEEMENKLKPKPKLPVEDFKGQETVFLFWNPECGFCLKMLDDVKAWEMTPPENARRLVVVSSGTVEQTRAQGISSTIVHGVGEQGTPSAVRVDAEGNIDSNFAVGAEQVLSLIRAAA